jgi:hypothetical protein
MLYLTGRVPIHRSNIDGWDEYRSHHEPLFLLLPLLLLLLLLLPLPLSGKGQRPVLYQPRPKA